MPYGDILSRKTELGMNSTRQETKPMAKPAYLNIDIMQLSVKLTYCFPDWHHCSIPAKFLQVTAC